MITEKKAAAQTAATNKAHPHIITSVEKALNNQLIALKNYQKFVVCKFVQNGNGKVGKIPVNYNTGRNCGCFDPINQTDSDTATRSAIAFTNKFEQLFGVGFVFTKNDPFFFLDIDNCIEPYSKKWSSLAIELSSIFKGAALEISYSHKGLHIFGTYTGVIKHKTKNTKW